MTDLLSPLHVTQDELDAQLPHIRQSPQQEGEVALIVCRPRTGQRKTLPQGELDLEHGLIGDNWLQRGNPKQPGQPAHPDTQLNLMNARTIAAITRDPSHWSLAGDQFYVDLDLSPANLPPGTRLAIGSATIEITAEPHLGCKKFLQRFGKAAAVWVNSPLGKSLNLRGVNAKVIAPGIVKPGDVIRKLAG